MTLHNDIGFNSRGSKDIATEITKKISISDHPTVVLKPPRHGTATNIRMSLIPPGSGVYALYVSR